MTIKHYNVIIIGTGPAGMGAAFYIKEHNPDLSILMLDKSPYSTGGMRNDCKMNFTFPIGFPEEYWSEQQANKYLDLVKEFLKPAILPKQDISRYERRASVLDTTLLDIEQTHLGTDGGLALIKDLLKRLESLGVDLILNTEVADVSENYTYLKDGRIFSHDNVLVAPGRHGFQFLQNLMKSLKIPYVDNKVDIGIRVETKLEHYPIVKDYYDPKFLFPKHVRTFCTNSGNAHVVKEKYEAKNGETYFTVNGHAFAKDESKDNGLVNFAILKTITLTEPVTSGQDYGELLGLTANMLGGGKPIMQRVGDFRSGHRSTAESFNDDLYDFKPSLNACPGDISIAMPSKTLRCIWSAMKKLDTIVPGVLHPSTIMYYPEIKFYSNKPKYLDEHFRVKENIYFAGDGAGTSRGITAAWASGIRAAEGILNTLIKEV